MEQDKPSKKPSRYYEFAKANWSDKLFAWSRQDDIGQAMGDNVDSVFASIAEYDFTKNSKKAYKYLFWICKLVIKSNIKPEDVYKIKDNLELFLRVQKKLPEDKQDIARIVSARELSDLVAPYRDYKSLGQLAREERELILAETEFLYDGEYGKILSPKTERAAVFWGQGTEWCFSATQSENWFNYYNDKSPLCIYITNDTGYRTVVKKIKDETTGKYTEQEIEIPYQVKFAGHMDSTLKDIHDQSFIAAIPQSLTDLVIHAQQYEFCFRNGSLTPTYFPSGTFSEDVLITCVRNKSIKKFKDIDEEDITEGICIAILESIGNTFTLCDIPKKLWVKDIYLLFVKNNPSNIWQIDLQERDYDIYYASVSADGEFLSTVPEDYQTDEMYKAAVISNGLALQFIPKDKQKKNTKIEEIRLIAVRQDGRALSFVPEDERSDTLCLEAVRQSHRALTYVPKEKRTEEIYRTCILGGWAERAINFREEISDKPYYKELVRLAYETMMNDPKNSDDDKKSLARHYKDVMTVREQKEVLGIIVPRPTRFFKRLAA